MPILEFMPSPYLDWQDWADTLLGLNPKLGNQIDANLDWYKFAERLAEIEPLAPQPALFADWRDWALALQSSAGVDSM